jgi:hypothetical protein
MNMENWMKRILTGRRAENQTLEGNFAITRLTLADLESKTELEQ